MHECVKGVKRQTSLSRLGECLHCVHAPRESQIPPAPVGAPPPCGVLQITQTQLES